jgi:hypothetical protein
MESVTIIQVDCRRLSSVPVIVLAADNQMRLDHLVAGCQEFITQT